VIAGAVRHGPNKELIRRELVASIVPCRESAQVSSENRRGSFDMAHPPKHKRRVGAQECPKVGHQRLVEGAKKFADVTASSLGATSYAKQATLPNDGNAIFNAASRHRAH
jgi:hypothetical protein